MSNILILDDEIYLAQKVEARLQDEGHKTTRLACVKDVNYAIHYDTILLSTNLAGNWENIIKKYQTSTILLFVTYINDATVTNPINDGASDYIMKPFNMNEVLRKIKHFEEFNTMKQEKEKINTYFDFFFNDTIIDCDIPKKFPFLIETNDKKVSEKIIYTIASNLNLPIKFLSLKQCTKIDQKKYKNELLCIYDFHILKDSAKKTLLEQCKENNIIICSDEKETIEIDKITIMKENNISTVDSILTVNDYVKQITLNFQAKYPDTELSRRLGISRKSLWEKRKKFGIEKKKLK